MGFISRALHPATAREAVRNLAVGTASLIAGTWLIALLTQYDWFKDPKHQVSEVTHFFAWLMSQHWFLLLTGLVFGFAVGVRLDTWLRPKPERRITDPDKIARLNNHIAEIYKTLGMALGARDRLTYDLAIAQCESFLLDLSRRNDIQIPELRADGTEAGTFRALCYLNAIVPALQLDDDAEARERASRIVPELNGKSAAELRTDLGLPDPPRPPSPNTAPHPMTVPIRQDAEPESNAPFGYSYRKAVLQALIKEPRGTLEKSGDAPHRLTIVLGVQNKHQKLMFDCSVIVTTLTGPDGKVVHVDKALTNGEAFPVDVRQPKYMPIVVRDISDMVTPAPFLLRTVGPGIPLKENSRYLAALELRSKYPHPTHVVVQIDTETGLNATCAIISQDVDRTGE